MSRNLASLSMVTTLSAGAAFAAPPQVAVDIAPVHSLVSRVMDGVGTPSLVVQSGASPHEYSLRPSDARALQDADVVFWIGEDLTPWMESAINTLAEDAAVTSLLEADGTTLLEFREGALFEEHTHDDDPHSDDHGDHDAHDHDDHDEHHHDEDHDHDEADAQNHEHDHDHEGHDPHVWLSPDNAVVWLDVIAARLSTADPDNAGTYFANAAAAKQDLEAVVADVSDVLVPVRDGRFIVFHDAYQYFEDAFDIHASGAISLSDASDPSPSRLTQVQDRIADENIQCVLSEPQFNEGIVAAVMDGTTAKTAVIDPLGSNLEIGADLYPQLLKSLAVSLADCLS